MTATCTGTHLDTVTVNADYASADGTATRVPAGRWAVKVRHRHGAWTTFAVPLHTNPAGPILLAVGDDQAAVTTTAIRWTSTARTLCMSYERIVYAGTGNARGERLNPSDVDQRWTALDTKEHRP